MGMTERERQTDRQTQRRVLPLFGSLVADKCKRAQNVFCVKKLMVYVDCSCHTVKTNDFVTILRSKVQF